MTDAAMAQLDLEAEAEALFKTLLPAYKLKLPEEDFIDACKGMLISETQARDLFRSEFDPTGKGNNIGIEDFLKGYPSLVRRRKKAVKAAVSRGEVSELIDE